MLLGPYDESCDVFSFGMLMWEVAHKAVPFGECTGLGALFRAQENNRPAMAEGTCPMLAALIDSCWLAHATLRPTMTEVVRQLTAVKLSTASNALVGKLALLEASEASNSALLEGGEQAARPASAASSADETYA